MKKLIFLVLFVLQCVLVKNDIWTDYSIRYIGSDAELNKFIAELTAKNYKYKIIPYIEEGLYEVQYREDIEKR